MILDKAPGFGLVLPELSLAELETQCCDVNTIMTSYIISHLSEIRQTLSVGMEQDT